MSPFDITFAEGPHTCVVHPVGDIDMAVVPELRSGIDDALISGCSNVVLDLTEVTYADSSALGLLVWLDHRLEPLSGRLVLAGATLDVARILELSGLVSVAASIAMSANVTAALEGLDLVPAATEALWREEVEVPHDVNELSAVREQVSTLIQPLDFPESAIFDIKVALGEALANAIRHGVAEAGDSEVEVAVIAYDDRVVLEIADNGVGYDGTPSDTADVYAPGGRGIMFMRALMDSVDFEQRAGGGTLVRLVKHRAGEVR